MRRKSKRRTTRAKEDRAFLLSAFQAVLSLCICMLFFMSAVIFDNSDIKEALFKLIREDGEFSEVLNHLKEEMPSEGFEKILGEAKFTSDGFEPLPLKDNITSPFGKRISPITGKAEIHKGIDIKAPEGEKISAAFPGKCEKIGENKFDGRYITLSHGNFKTKYCHLSKILIEEGMNLREGEVLGCVGSTGYATGSHLHFEIIKGDKYIEPKSAFKREVYEI